jgi:hypothetical protein
VPISLPIFFVKQKHRENKPEMLGTKKIGKKIGKEIGH